MARLGAGDVRVLEREDDAGGIPRHCGHPPFGARDYRRIYTGPRYAARAAGRGGGTRRAHSHAHDSRVCRPRTTPHPLHPRW
ncbi:MAG: hypothetical protein M5U09_15050 [Gammaproteobacteria bacterium]|nr:hypothetical protein [Gammaproteobacteria bacterium]